MELPVIIAGVELATFFVPATNAIYFSPLITDNWLAPLLV